TSDNVTQIGAVTILFGSANGLTTSGKKIFEPEHIDLTTQPNAPLVLTAGDFNADNFSDLLVASPLSGATIPCVPQPPATTCTNTNFNGAGVVHVFYGGNDGPISTTTGTNTDPDLPSESIAGVPGGGPRDNERFGAAVAVGDFNGD